MQINSKLLDSESIQSFLSQADKLQRAINTQVDEFLDKNPKVTQLIGGVIQGVKKVLGIFLK